MKHFLTVLLCLFLLGCAPEEQAVPADTASQVPGESADIGMYDPSHPMEARYPGLVRGYPLTQRKVHGVRAFGKDVLILSGQGNTTLMLLSGDDLHETAARTVGFELSQEDPSLRFHEDHISFYDPKKQETVLLDRKLQPVRSIPVPGEISGKPILSADTGTLYYCTDWAVVAWDLDSGIRRTVKELHRDSQQLTGLHRDDRILECTVTEAGRTEILLLSEGNGSEQRTLPEGSWVRTGDSGYFASIRDGFQDLMIFSREGEEKRLLLPRELTDSAYYLQQAHGLVTVRVSGEETLLEHYELTGGTLTASLTLDRLQTPKNIECSGDGFVYILVYDPAEDRDTLCRWDVRAAELPQAASCAYPYRDGENADILEQCRQYAERIREKYGITVKTGADACAAQPWDYQFTEENLSPVLLRELELLEQRLARYPEQVLQRTVSRFDRLTLCLVRTITGSAGSDSLHTATGIQFFEGEEAYVVIATGRHSEQALYHELYHVIETHILTKSTALDQWEALNPADFSYGAGDTPEIYLQGETRAFVDSYSMGYPKEDRARILENAMLEGKESIFRSEYMQRKLTALCRGIRDAYGLKNAEDALPWEQYLVTPLT